jgi:hypothetical protein
MHAADWKREEDVMGMSTGKLSSDLERFDMFVEDVRSVGTPPASCTAVTVDVTEVIAA